MTPPYSPQDRFLGSHESHVCSGVYFSNIFKSDLVFGEEAKLVIHCS